MAARTYARASGRSGCEDILLKILKLCLQNDAEAKMNMNPDKVRSIVEIMEKMEYWTTFDGKKSSAEDKSEKKSSERHIEKFPR